MERKEDTFLTSVPKNKPTFEMDTSMPNGDAINALYGQISGCISELDNNLGSIVSKHEADFLKVYKSHMHTIQQEMRGLKKRLGEEELRRKRDAELIALERERDWFREEALRLDKFCKENKKSMEVWKNKAQTLEEDNKFMESQIIQAKSQNLKLKEQIESHREPPVPVKNESPKMIEHVDHELCRQRENDYLAQIKSLAKENLALKKNLKMIKYAKTNYVLEKGELEDFFYECIEEVKKDINKRRELPRSFSTKQFKGKGSVSLAQFTATDKKRVVEKLVSSEDVTYLVKNAILPKERERPMTGASRNSKQSSHVYSIPRFNENHAMRPSTAPRPKIFK